MSLPTGTGTQKSLDTIFGEVESLARQIKNVSTASKNRADGGTEDADHIITTFQQLGIYRNRLNALSVGIDVAAANAYAQERYDDPTFNMATEFTAVINGIDGVLSWVESNADAATLMTFDATAGAVTWNTYTKQQLGGYSDALGSLIALID